MYAHIMTSLRQIYASNASIRDQSAFPTWKVDERQRVLNLFQANHTQRLLEIGAGPGRDSKFFQDQGLDVTATDLSPEMIALCRAKGLDAYEMDFLSLDFPPESFDAVYAMNCLLHVPKADLRSILEIIRQLLRPGGLFYLGVYGGFEFEGIWEEDRLDPKRFFSFHTDEQLKTAVSKVFSVEDFKTIQNNLQSDLYFQALLLRRSSS